MKLIFTFLTLLSFPLFASDGELKTKDLHHLEVNGSNTSATSETITPEQLEQLKKDMEKIKSNKAKSDEFLKELDSEI